MLDVPAAASSMMMPSTNPMSPTRVTRNALTAACRAASRSLSCPTSRYEQRPMTSQPMSSSSRSSACTTSSIAAVNSDTTRANDR